MEPSRYSPNENITSETPPANITSDAKELASDAVERAKELAKEQVAEQQERSAGQIVKLAAALHHTSEELGDSAAAPYVEKAATMLDKLSGSVRDANVRDTVRATERFARREPFLFLGGAFTLGLLAARFFKSAGRNPSNTSSSSFGARDTIGGTRRR